MIATNGAGVSFGRWAAPWESAVLFKKGGVFSGKSPPSAPQVNHTAGQHEGNRESLRAEYDSDGFLAIAND